MNWFKWLVWGVKGDQSTIGWFSISSAACTNTGPSGRVSLTKHEHGSFCGAVVGFIGINGIYGSNSKGEKSKTITTGGLII